MSITLTNKKITYYTQIVDNEQTGRPKEIILNEDKLNIFIDSQKPGTYIKTTKEVVKKLPSEKKRGFLHGGVIAELANHMGVADRKWLKDQLKEIWLKIDFKKKLELKRDSEGNLILGEDKRPVMVEVIIIDEDTGLPIPVENQFFDLTPDEIREYYSMYKLWPKGLTYPTHLLSDEAYGRFIQVVTEYIREQFGLDIQAKKLF